MANHLSRMAGIALAAALSVGCSNMLDQAARDARDRDAAAMANAEPEPKPHIMPGTHFSAGQMLETKGDLEAAVGQYEKTIAADPKFAPAYNRLGITHQKRGRLADAEKAFRQGIQVEPGNPTLRNNLGYHYLLMRRFEDAERELRAALALKPGFPLARMNLAVTLAQTGRFNMALTEFRRVVPEETAHFNIGVICLDRNDVENAREAFNRALAANPDCPGARAQLDRLDSLAAGNVGVDGRSAANAAGNRPSGGEPGRGVSGGPYMAGSSDAEAVQPR